MKQSTLSILGCLGCHANLTLATPGNMFQFAPIHRWELTLLFASVLSCIQIGESVKLKAVRNTIH